MISARDITTFLHNRYGVIFLSLVAIAGIFFAGSHGLVNHIPGEYGLIVTSPNNWLAPGTTSTVLCIIMNLMVALSAISLNKQYNTMRSLSMLVAGGFMIMQLATPSALGIFNGSAVMAVGISILAMLLFSIFSDYANSRRVFLIFFLLSSFSLFEYSFLFYVPIMLLGLRQMRVFNLRTFTASIIGIITPWWILFGFGLITLADIRVPHFISVMAAINSPGIWYQLIVIGITIIVGITFMMMNAIKMLSYNSRIRAANGFLVSLMLATMLFIFVDYNNFMVYVTLLNILVAYQIGHYFATRIQSYNSYIGILSMLLIYLALFAGRFIL